jgi:exopolyphosphatase/guanosine-5'-triphosphate,3'-diphosphate pyrophosphatase
MLDKKNYIAIIDIGSNAVRLVVYDGLNRAPLKIHNERIICNLGADLATTGNLHPAGVQKALDGIHRFSGLLAVMKITTIRAVATAAVRDAHDGQAFIDTIQKDFALTVTVIDGEEEARLSALGVLANGLGNNGLIGDYGGGSLELIVVENMRVKHKASLPLGSHRLLAEQGRAARLKTIDKHLDSVAFLNDYKGKDFYALGGAWRSMAKAHMYLVDHPLKVLDHYQIDGGKALEFAALLSRQSMASLEKTVGMSKKRVKDMGVAALVMERMFERIQPRNLIFSGTGLREGSLFDQLRPSTKKQDPLLASCAKIALKISRFEDLKAFNILAQWMDPLFKGQSTELLQWVHASCLLSDSSWFEHEDYQADHAFQRILVLPFYGVNHQGRAFLALSQYVRYKGYLRRSRRAKEGEDITKAAQKLLNENMPNKNMVEWAEIAGLAQRMGYLLTGGALGLLRHTTLTLTPEKLTLDLHDKADVLNAEIIQSALDELSDKLKQILVIPSRP